MQIASLIWGILSIVGLFIGLLPCFGSLNWINIPVSFLGLIFSIVTLVTTKEDKKGMAIAGIICCALAVLIGTIRLIMGAGVV
ncbi:MAG: hypothetical protein NTY74_04395 [Ignavibacteriae bacterium]|nr:hypothetical protein [Ignavibacteriota bacterium]